MFKNTVFYDCIVSLSKVDLNAKTNAPPVLSSRPTLVLMCQSTFEVFSSRRLNVKISRDDKITRNNYSFSIEI